MYRGKVATGLLLAIRAGSTTPAAGNYDAQFYWRGRYNPDQVCFQWRSAATIYCDLELLALIAGRRPPVAACSGGSEFAGWNPALKQGETLRYLQRWLHTIHPKFKSRSKTRF